MRRWRKWIGLGLLTLVLLAVTFVAVATAKTKLPGEEMTSAGIRQASSEYVKMHDGVEIAVTVWLPLDWKPGERVPALMRTTRYWRGPKLGWGLRMLVALHWVHVENLVDKQRAYFNERRFAVIASGLSAQLWPGRTFTCWTPIRSFTTSSSVPPLPSFSQRDCRPVPRGLPSSVKQLRTTQPFGLSRSWRTFAHHLGVTANRFC